MTRKRLDGKTFLTVLQIKRLWVHSCWFDWCKIVLQILLVLLSHSYISNTLPIESLLQKDKKSEYFSMISRLWILIFMFTAIHWVHHQGFPILFSELLWHYLVSGQTYLEKNVLLVSAIVPWNFLNPLKFHGKWRFSIAKQGHHFGLPHSTIGNESNTTIASIGSHLAEKEFQ